MHSEEQSSCAPARYGPRTRPPPALEKPQHRRRVRVEHLRPHEFSVAQLVNFIEQIGVSSPSEALLSASNVRPRGRTRR